AQVLTANTLLAIGAVPSMTISQEEVEEFVGRADGLLINLGTLDAVRTAASAIAIDAANTRNLPWVLDPVFVDRSAARANYARELIASAPSVIRLNRAEFTALAGRAPDDDVPSSFARERNTVIALTGPTDFVSDGTRTARITNGHPLMAKVTTLGCAESAL